jgi:hypothetical protein
MMDMRERLNELIREVKPTPGYPGMICRTCEHPDWLHCLWVGDCIQEGCKCVGMDKPWPDTVTETAQERIDAQQQVLNAYLPTLKIRALEANRD